MTVYIKNMVCLRCKMAVQSVLEKLQIEYQSIELGKVNLRSAITTEQLELLNAALNYYELEVMDDKKKILVERIKVCIIEKLNSSSSLIMEEKLSLYLSKHLHYHYTYLANVFSEMERCTLERHYIESRIERVKELIVYEAISLKEISYRLNFSSVSHLCLQFKKVTGQTPSQFKKLCESEDFVWRNL